MLSSTQILEYIEYHIYSLIVVCAILMTISIYKYGAYINRKKAEYYYHVILPSIKKYNRSIINMQKHSNYLISHKSANMTFINIRNSHVQNINNSNQRHKLEAFIAIKILTESFPLFLVPSESKQH